MGGDAGPVGPAAQRRRVPRRRRPELRAHGQRVLPRHRVRPRHHRTPTAGSRAARDRANLPAAGRGHRRPHADDARSIRPRDHVEPRRRADQGMGGRGDRGTPFRRVLPSRRALRRASPHATWNRLRPTGSRTTKAGTCGAMVAASGPRRPSRRSATTTARCAATPRSPATAPRATETRARLEALAELNRAALEQRPEEELVMIVVSRPAARWSMPHSSLRGPPTPMARSERSRPRARHHARHRFGGRRRLDGHIGGRRDGRCEVVRDVYEKTTGTSLPRWAMPVSDRPCSCRSPPPARRSP